MYQNRKILQKIIYISVVLHFDPNPEDGDTLRRPYYDGNYSEMKWSMTVLMT